MAQPEIRARRLVVNRATAANLSAEHRARLVDHAAMMRSRITPEGKARSQRPEVRQRVGRENAERALAWCPQVRRGEYLDLRRRGFPAQEARAIVEAEIRRASATAPKPPRTFAEQLQAVAAGAQLVAKFKPRRADPQGTLGGVASGLL